ncbi:MAG: hypothetical protein LUC37_04830 [Prevotella sp.]|nr:hypothetical protein [Prevotella sp.]
MNEQIQQYAAQILQAAMQGDEKAQQMALQTIGVGLQVMAQQQQQQGAQVQAAKFGAKLDYVKHLRGECPTGYEMQYFKAGGQLCKKCVKKQNGGNMKNKATTAIGEDAINEFRCGSKMRKHAVGGAVNSKEMPNGCPCKKKK